MNSISFSDYSYKECLRSTQYSKTPIAFTGKNSAKLKEIINLQRTGCIDSIEKTLIETGVVAVAPGGVLLLPNLVTSWKEAFSKIKESAKLNLEGRGLSEGYQLFRLYKRAQRRGILSPVKGISDLMKKFDKKNFMNFYNFGKDHVLGLSKKFKSRLVKIL